MKPHRTCRGTNSRRGIIVSFLFLLLLLLQQVHQSTSFTAISTSLPSITTTPQHTSSPSPTQPNSSSSINYHRPHHPILKTTITTTTTTTRINAAAQTTTTTTQNHPYIFVLSYDGVVADTTEWRAKLAIRVALEIWPHLRRYYTTHDNDNDNGGDNIANDDDWLLNKLSALIPATLSSRSGSAEGGVGGGGGGDDGSMGCDAVLLTRLLLEEQLLDKGRSNGRGGKYGSKFHPSSSSIPSNTKTSNGGGGGGSSNGSRPLTVGEITANWNDGACLRDTVRIRYNIDRKDPIPIIREGIRNHLLTTRSSSSDFEDDCGDDGGGGDGGVPDIHPSIIDALLDCTSPVYILVGDESHVPMAVSSLGCCGIAVETMIWNDDDDGDINGEDSFLDVHPGITILSSSSRRRTGKVAAGGILRYILMSADRGSYIHMVNSDVTALQRAKILFGDNRPMMRTGMFGKIGLLLAKTAATGDVADDDDDDDDDDIREKYLKLSLSKWNSGPQQQNDAMMDPWLNLIDDSELVEALSARIVTAK